MSVKSNAENISNKQGWENNTEEVHEEDELFLSKASDVIFLVVRILLVIAVIVGIMSLAMLA